MIPSPHEVGRGRGPVAPMSNGEGEVCFRGTIASPVATHLT